MSKSYSKWGCLWLAASVLSLLFDQQASGFFEVAIVVAVVNFAAADILKALDR